MKTERQILERLVESYKECSSCYYPSGVFSAISDAAELLNIELAATDSQQLKAEILPIVDRALLDVIDGNCDKAILSLNKLTAKLSAV